MKMSWAVTMGWGLLCGLSLRRRFRLAFLLKVCFSFSGVLVGLVPTWMVVGDGKLLFVRCEVRECALYCWKYCYSEMFCYFSF